MIRTHPGRGELSFRPQEQHALVHGSQATEGLRRSCDLQMGVWGGKTLGWSEAQVHLREGESGLASFLLLQPRSLPLESPSNSVCTSASQITTVGRSTEALRFLFRHWDWFRKTGDVPVKLWSSKRHFGSLKFLQIAHFWYVCTCMWVWCNTRMCTGAWTHALSRGQRKMWVPVSHSLPHRHKPGAKLAPVKFQQFSCLWAPQH